MSRHYILVLLGMVLLPSVAAGDNFPKICKIADLPFCAGGPEPGRVVWVRDGLDASDCTVGGGADQHLCVREGDGTFGTTGGGGGAGSVRTCVELPFRDDGDIATPYSFPEDTTVFGFNSPCFCQMKIGNDPCNIEMTVEGCDSAGTNCGAPRLEATCTCRESGTIGICIVGTPALPQANETLHFVLGTGAPGDLIGISTCFDATY